MRKARGNCCYALGAERLFRVQGFYSICLLVNTHGNFSWPIHIKRKLSLG